MVSAEAVKAIFDLAMDGTSPLAEVCARSIRLCAALNDLNTHPPRLTMEDWAEAQAADPNLKVVLVLYHARQLYQAKMVDYDSYESLYQAQRQALAQTQTIIL